LGNSDYRAPDARRVDRKGETMPRIKTRSGQGLVEYIILITLMGIALIATVRNVSRDTNQKFRQASAEIQNLGSK
jgi:Flp pilus assembly pilin Flp